MTGQSDMESRLQRVEEKVQHLSQLLEEKQTKEGEAETLPWWKKRAQLFKDHLDLYDQAAALGRTWRDTSSGEEVGVKNAS
jgi:hypothetical protein